MNDERTLNLNDVAEPCLTLSSKFQESLIRLLVLLSLISEYHLISISEYVFQRIHCHRIKTYFIFISLLRLPR